MVKAFISRVSFATNLAYDTRFAICLAEKLYPTNRLNLPTTGKSSYSQVGM